MILSGVNRLLYIVEVLSDSLLLIIASIVPDAIGLRNFIGLKIAWHSICKNRGIGITKRNMTVNKKASERLVEVNHALDVLRKEGAPVGDVDKILNELEEKVLQEEVCPSLREAVTPLLSLIGHKVSLRIEYVPGSPLDIHIDKNFAPDACPADDQKCRKGEYGDADKGRMMVVGEMEEEYGHEDNCFTVRNENGKLVLGMPGMYDGVSASHQNTLSCTLRAIVNFQKDFFETGRVSSLKPMMLNDIEEKTGLDKSTVSRAVSGKVVVTDYGRYNLKYFFSEGIEKSGGRVSSRVLEEDIRSIIADEDKSNPLTDDGMVDVLTDMGYVIARRTVAKYRMQLGIPVARDRKEETVK